MLLLLDLNGRAVLEGPFDDISLVGGALDELALLESRPELAEVLELDQVPNIAERRLNYGRLADRGGGGNASRHYDLSCSIDLAGCVSVRFMKICTKIGCGGVVLKFGGAHVCLSN